MSSTELATDEVETQDANIATSSDANVDTKAEVSTFDLVKEVVGKQTEEATPASDGEVKAEVEKTDAEPEAEKKDAPENPDELFTEAEKKQLSEKTQARIRDLVSQRRERDAKIAEHEGKLNELSPKAEAFEKIAEFTRQNNLEAMDIDNTLALAALIKNNPIEGFKQLDIVYQQLARQVGHVLPDQLQQRVQQGFMSEADAREMARLQAMNQFRDRQAQEQVARAKAEADAAQQQQRQQTAVRVTNEWAANKAKNDPAWAAKHKVLKPMLEGYVKANGVPADEKTLVDTLEGFLETVNEGYKQLVPTPRAVTPVMSSSSSKAPLVPEPKSSLDVIKNVLSGMAS